MSFILDALRKSEHERERNAIPGRYEPPRSREPSSRLAWIIGGLAALLVVNLAIVGWLLLRPAATPAPVAAPARSAATPAPVAVLREPASPPGRTVERHIRSLAGETQATDASLDYPVPDLAAPRALADEPRPTARALADHTHHPTTAMGGLPTINDLPATATAGLPRLNIDLLVYNSDPAQRFAIINGQKLHDGGQMKEGPKVEQITADGVILVHQGTRFLLPAT